MDAQCIFASQAILAPAMLFPTFPEKNNSGNKKQNS